MEATRLPSFQAIVSGEGDRPALLRELEAQLNRELQASHQSVAHDSEEQKARFVIDRVEAIVDELNAHGYKLGRIDYGGDVDFRNSEQWYSDKLTSGNRLILRFLGFSCTAEWEGEGEW